MIMEKRNITLQIKEMTNFRVVLNCETKSKRNEILRNATKYTKRRNETQRNETKFTIMRNEMK
jgi:hypothetical protein